MKPVEYRVLLDSAAPESTDRVSWSLWSMNRGDAILTALELSPDCRVVSCQQAADWPTD